jgi:hypothetical protein
MAALEAAIQSKLQIERVLRSLDGRVKPGHDE